jgi:hypothetical protein
VITQTPAKHDSDRETDACGSARRNRFFRGKTMRAEEFLIEQGYGIGRRRLLTRSIAGWGVVYGMSFETSGHHDDEQAAETQELLRVLPGLAIDRHGREAVLLETTRIGVSNTFLIEEGAGGCRLTSIEYLPPGDYLLSVHYAERRIEPVRLPEECGCAGPEQGFTCETAVFSLRKLPNGKCECGEPSCERTCRCGGHGCSPAAGRGPHACLCQWSAEATVPAGAGRLCLWGEYWTDPDDGIGLACVRVEAMGDECRREPRGWVIDACTPRRLVKTNDLLYDLIRGCDLTRIESISWAAWHRAEAPVEWKDFVDMLRPPVPGEADHLTGFAVTFSGPVQARTLTPDCFSLRFTVSGEDTGWFETRAVSITRVLPEAQPGDPAGTARIARLYVDADWYEEVLSHGNVFKREGATAILEVNGDFILDCHGQAVDANARGFALRDRNDGRPIEPSGNGMPGGQFVSVFRIQQRPPRP